MDANQPVTFTAFVKLTAPLLTSATGTMYFFDGMTLLGSQTVNNGMAFLSPTSPLSVGTHSDITAAYVPDAASTDNFAPSGLSAPLTETILPSEGTSVTVSSSAPTSVVGQLVTFTATITLSTPTTAVPTGTMYFFDGDAFLGSSTGVAVSNSMATITTSSLSVGLHADITAAYVPDAASSSEFGASGLSAPLTENIVPTQMLNIKDGTTVNLTSSPTVTTAGQSVTFTAVVIPTSPTAAIPTGTVQFFDGNNFLGLSTGVTVSDGVATVTTSSLSVGSHNIQVNYVPDAASAANFASSGLCGLLAETINPDTVTNGPGYSAQAQVYASQNTAFFQQNQSVMLTAIVSPSKAGVSSPTGGTEYFFDGMTLLGSTTVINGVATMNTSLSSLDIGTNMITTAYVPNPTSLYAPSGLSQSFQLFVNPV